MCLIQHVSTTICKRCIFSVNTSQWFWDTFSRYTTVELYLLIALYYLFIYCCYLSGKNVEKQGETEKMQLPAAYNGDSNEGNDKDHSCCRWPRNQGKLFPQLRLEVICVTQNERQTDYEWLRWSLRSMTVFIWRCGRRRGGADKMHWWIKKYRSLSMLRGAKSGEL